MAITPASELSLDYDEEMDVLYASVGSPQEAVSDEVEPDILLRYVPPAREVVGITIMNFRRHFPRADARNVVIKLLRKFPIMPEEGH
jgi:uncharacterized protein YuzE